MGKFARKVMRRLARDERIAAGKHPNANKGTRQAWQRRQAHEWQMEAVVHGLLHALGHRTKRREAYRRGVMTA
jgi:hypothetical protein